MVWVVCVGLGVSGGRLWGVLSRPLSLARQAGAPPPRGHQATAACGWRAFGSNQQKRCRRLGARQWGGGGVRRPASTRDPKRSPSPPLLLLLVGSRLRCLLACFAQAAAASSRVPCARTPVCAGMAAQGPWRSCVCPSVCVGVGGLHLSLPSKRARTGDARRPNGLSEGSIRATQQDTLHKCMGAPRQGKASQAKVPTAHEQLPLLLVVVLVFLFRFIHRSLVASTGLTLTDSTGRIVRVLCGVCVCVPLPVVVAVVGSSGSSVPSPPEPPSPLKSWRLAVCLLTSHARRAPCTCVRPSNKTENS